MFGQNKPGLFGSPQPAAPAFGSTSTGFGAAATTPFGVQQQPTTSLFGSSAGTTFGGMGATTGASLFSNPQQTSIFGNTTTTQTPFGQTNTANTFGRPAGGIFGSTTQATSGLGQVGGFGFGTQNAFGTSAGQAVTGTTVKFNPTPGSDTMLKNGATQSINTRHQCITVMKEYEGKSLEELRMEDYAAGRKGPVAGSTIGAFGTPAAGSLFGGNTAATATTGFGTPAGTSLFGNPALKSTFGTPSLTPATQSNSLFGNTSFAKPGAFGSTTSFGTVQPQQQVQPQPQTSLFGQTTSTAQPFGQTSFFNNPAQNTAKPSFFGSTMTQQPQQQTSLFGSNTGLNTGLNTSIAKPLFGTTTPAFSSGLGSSTSFPAFGTSTTTTTANSLFSSNQQSLFGNNAAKPTTSFSFGNPAQQTSFGTMGQAAPSLNTGSSLFGTSNAFGTNTGGSLFQSSLGTQSSLFPSMQQHQLTLPGYPGVQNNNNMGQGPQTNAANEMILTRLRTLPYGVSPLFQNDLTSGSMSSSQFTTDAKTLNQYKLNTIEPVVKRVPASSKPVLLFDDIDDDEDTARATAADIFQPKKSIKKLVFAPKSVPEGEANRSATFEIKSPVQQQPLTEVKKLPVSPADNTICEFIKNRENAERSRRGLNFSIETLPEDDEASFSLHLSASAPLLKCGLSQSRQDYYTIPKLEDIDNFYDEEKDTCYVDTFTIGRKGYGSIFWNCQIDLKGLNLDEIVHIRRKEVIVYPDDEDKPPVGQGLNKPAQITLDQVWPIDKNSHEIIKDVRRLEELNYASKLEATTVRLNAIFKDYRPETGSWVFNVKHFSKYGLFDEEEDDVVMAEAAVKTTPSKPLQTTPVSRRYLESDRAKRDADVPDKSPGQSIRPITSFTSAFTTSFEQMFMDFPKPEDYVYKGPMRPASEERSLKQTYPTFEYYDGIRSVLFDEDEDQESERKPTKRSKIRSPSESLLISPVAGGPMKHRPPIKIPQIHVTKRELKFFASLFPSKNKVILDVSSIKCSSAAIGRFFNGSRNLLSSEGRTLKTLSVETCPDLTEEPGLMQRFVDQLKSQTLITGHEQHIPFADVRRNSINPFNSDDLNGLVIALYGDLKAKSEYEMEEERRNAVIDWLTERNKANKVPSDSYSRIFHFLCVNDVKSAVDEAIRTNQPRLALMIASGTCSLAKDEMLSQLESWKISGADKFIDRQVVMLFILMSGQTHWLLSSEETVACVEHLTWSQQLALTLIYCPDVPMEHLVHGLPSDSLDVEYHLLAEHNKNQWLVFDYCADDLESWFLHQSLVSFNAIPRDPKSDSLHSVVSSQLMDQSVMWASFVAIHVADNTLRHRLLSEILHHNGSSITSADESFLENSLLISRSEIAAAKAVSCKSAFDDIGHCMALLDCGKWAQAHDLLIDRIFPDLVINEETEMLAELIERMRPHCHTISNWFTSGAHIYDVYRQVVSDDEAVVPLLQKEPVSMHLMRCSTPKHVLAQSEMAHKICLFCTLHGASSDVVSGAPLPDDYVLIHAKKATFELIEKLLE